MHKIEAAHLHHALQELAASTAGGRENHDLCNKTQEYASGIVE